MYARPLDAHATSSLLHAKERTSGLRAPASSRPGPDGAVWGRSCARRVRHAPQIQYSGWGGRALMAPAAMRTAVNLLSSANSCCSCSAPLPLPPPLPPPLPLPLPPAHDVLPALAPAPGRCQLPGAAGAPEAAVGATACAAPWRSDMRECSAPGALCKAGAAGPPPSRKSASPPSPTPSGTRDAKTLAQAPVGRQTVSNEQRRPGRSMRPERRRCRRVRGKARMLEWGDWQVVHVSGTLHGSTQVVLQRWARVDQHAAQDAGETCRALACVQQAAHTRAYRPCGRLPPACHHTHPHHVGADPGVVQQLRNGGALLGLLPEARHNEVAREFAQVGALRRPLLIWLVSGACSGAQVLAKERALYA